MFLLAHFYEKGIGIKSSQAKAARWYWQATERMSLLNLEDKYDFVDKPTCGQIKEEKYGFVDMIRIS